MTRDRLAGLDALRGIAAVAVLIWHMPEYAPGLFPSIKGYLAVDFFFMLSGYVMARTYEARLAAGLSPLAFLRARYRKFWPTMAVGTLIGLPLLAVYSPEQSAWFAAFGLMLVPVFSAPYLFPANAVAWSIAFELVANALHAVVLYRFRTPLLLASAAAFAAMEALLAMRFGTLDLGSRPSDFLAGFPRLLAPYCLGICLWRMWRDVPPIRVPALVTMLILPSGVVLARHWMLEIAFVLVACPLLIAGGLQWRAGKFGIALGAMSFPFYAVQLPVMDIFRLGGVHWAVGLATAVLLSAAMAVGGHPAHALLIGRRDRSSRCSA